MSSYYYTPEHYRSYIEYRYAALMHSLKEVVTDKYIEKSLASSSNIDEFKNNLIKNFPHYKETINQTFNYYDKLQ